MRGFIGATGGFGGGLRFLLINAWCARLVRAPIANSASSCSGNQEFVIRPIAKTELAVFRSLHHELRPGKSFSVWRRAVYRLWGHKLLWAAFAAPNGPMIAFNMYYFREGEWRQHIVHEAFIGVASAYRGLGIATALRQAAGRYFAECDVQGISTQIEGDNLPSLRSATKLGFQVVGSAVRGKMKLMKSF